jgi:hypothetical protein
MNNDELSHKALALAVKGRPIKPRCALKITNTFWDITPCSWVEVHRILEGTYCLYLQSRRVRHTGNYQEAGGKQSEWYSYRMTDDAFSAKAIGLVIKGRSQKLSDLFIARQRRV